MNDQKPWQKIAGIVVVLIAVVLVGYYIYTGSTSLPSIEDNEQIIETNDVNVGVEGDNTETDYNVDVSLGGTPTSGVVEVIDIPDLNRPVEFFIELPQELKDLYKSRIEKLTQELVFDSSAVGNWIDLGVQRKGIGDYEGAREIWEYTSIVSPQNNVSFFNLGDLYHFYLKDYVAAEKNLLTAKNNNKSYIPTYRALYDLYTLSYKLETNAAENILREGLENNPNNLDLLVLLAMYYKKEGNVEGASTYYEKALDEAEKLGNQSMVGLLKEELENL